MKALCRLSDTTSILGFEGEDRAFTFCSIDVRSNGISEMVSVPYLIWTSLIFASRPCLVEWCCWRLCKHRLCFASCSIPLRERLQNQIFTASMELGVCSLMIFLGSLFIEVVWVHTRSRSISVHASTFAAPKVSILSFSKLFLDVILGAHDVAVDLFSFAKLRLFQWKFSVSITQIKIHLWLHVDGVVHR